MERLGLSTLLLLRLGPLRVDTSPPASVLLHFIFPLLLSLPPRNPLRPSRNGPFVRRNTHRTLSLEPAGLLALRKRAAGS